MGKTKQKNLMGADVATTTEVDYSELVEEVAEMPKVVKGKPFVDYVMGVFERSPDKVLKLLVPEGKKYPKGVSVLRANGIKVSKRGADFYAMNK